VHTHLLTESDFGYDTIGPTFKMAAMTSFHKKHSPPRVTSLAALQYLIHSTFVLVTFTFYTLWSEVCYRI